jgi:hypothetical protein
VKGKEKENWRQALHLITYKNLTKGKEGRSNF